MGSGDLLPPSPPGEKATARQDQAGKTSTGDGAGDTTGDRRIVVSLEATPRRVVDSAAQDKLSDGLPLVGKDVKIICGLVWAEDAKE
jgi:hypothetical protein